MNPITIILIAALLAAGLQTGTASQSPSQVEKLLASAHHKATVDGDLKGAIEAYKKVVASAGTNRALVATALVRMAECHQKLGDAEARKIYDRVIRDFADQKEAVTIARARLGLATSSTAARGDRAVWTGPMVDIFGRVSPDGRSITFVDWQTTGNLMVHDLVTNTDRALTPNKKYGEFGEAGYSLISPDGRLVSYGWHDTERRAMHWLHVTSLDGSAQPRELISFSDKETNYIVPFDWSPDGKWIAMLIERNDGTAQISLVAVADGTLRILKPTGWQRPERIFFSKDSRYIAYDWRTGENDQRDVFILAIDRTSDTPAVVHSANDNPMGWSPDGSLLLFSSDRTGSTSLWGLPVAEGKPQGVPELLKADIGDGISLGLTAAGTLYMFKKTSSRDIRVAPIDLQAGKLGTPTHFTGGYLANPRRPDWSPDGTRLAYQACGGGCIAIRTIATGEVRQLPRKLVYPVMPHWSPDGRRFVAAGRDARRGGIFIVDAETGDASSVVFGPGFISNPQWSPDGLKIYYTHLPQGTITERELASGNERVVYKHPSYGGGFGFVLSPDGRWLAIAARDDKGWLKLVVPVEGGQPRELLRTSSPDTLGAQRWTPDSSSLLVSKTTAGRSELFIVPISGGTPRKLAIDATEWMHGGTGPTDQGFSLSRDGRHIAFLTGKTTAEIWALENFLPSRTVTK